MSRPKERDPKLIFKRFDLVADGRLGDVQFLGRSGEAQMASSGFECPQRIQRRQVAAHRIIHVLDFLMVTIEMVVCSISQYVINFGYT